MTSMTEWLDQIRNIRAIDGTVDLRLLKEAAASLPDQVVASTESQRELADFQGIAFHAHFAVYLDVSEKFFAALPKPAKPKSTNDLTLEDLGL